MTVNFARSTGSLEKRRSGRPPAGLEAALRERGSSAVQVSVTDISAYGCRITGHFRSNPQAQIWLKLAGLSSLPVNVVWSEGQVMGVEFETPLHPAVAQRFMPTAGSHAAYGANQNGQARGELLSRREQIIAGIAGSDLSPLQRRKRPSGLGLSGRISRSYQRKTDHRFEFRYAEGLQEGPREVGIDGLLAQVANVSSSGLKVQLDEPNGREIGDNVQVEFEGFPEVTGTIVWIKQAELGISLPPKTIELFDASND